MERYSFPALTVFLTVCHPDISLRYCKIPGVYGVLKCKMRVRLVIDDVFSDSDTLFSLCPCTHSQGNCVPDHTFPNLSHMCRNIDKHPPPLPSDNSENQDLLPYSDIASLHNYKSAHSLHFSPGYFSPWHCPCPVSGRRYFPYHSLTD